MVGKKRIFVCEFARRKTTLPSTHGKVATERRIMRRGSALGYEKKKKEKEKRKKKKRKGEKGKAYMCIRGRTIGSK